MTKSRLNPPAFPAPANGTGESTRRRTGHGGVQTSSRTRVLMSACLAVVLLLSGCSAIPSSGPVQMSEELLNDESESSVGFSPMGPQEGDSPEAIVDGFINAGTGTENNYRTARQFLAPGIADSWRPDVRTLVYRGIPNIIEGATEDTFSVTLDLVRTVDAEGVSRPVSESGTDTVEYSLTQLPNGEWRISEAPDGIMMSTSEFAEVFDPHNLYFYSPNYRYAVPDVRWFALGPSVPASLVRVMLNGPAPHLKGAVISAFNDGTTLASPAVAVDSGVALVDLTPGATEGASLLQRQRMQKQLEMMLLQLNNVSSVEMTVGQREVDLPEDSDRVSPVMDPQVPTVQAIVKDKELALYEGLEVLPAGDLVPVSDLSPRDPAISYNERLFAFLNGERSQMFITAPGIGVNQVLAGKLLTEPSFDPYGWLWTAHGDDSGKIFSINAGRNPGQVASVEASWLEGTVTDLKISRDGARAMVITNDGEESQVMISGVIRNEQGVPTELTVPLQLQKTVPADRGAWIDETSVVVMKASATEDVQAEILRPGASTVLAGLEGLTHISAGNGDQQIYGQTDDAIFLQVGTTWSEQTEGVKDPSFAG